MTNLEKGTEPEELTVYLIFEERGIGFNALALPLHKQPECDPTWYQLKQGEKIQLQYKQAKGKFTQMITTEHAWWETAG